MDEREQNPLTINNILEQLIKPSVVQGGVGPISQPKLAVPPLIPPKPAVVPPPIPSSKQPEGSISLPQLNRQGPQGPTLKSANEIISRPFDRRLTIRTMRDDLARLKQGLTPLGLEAGTKKTNVSISAKQEPPLGPTKIVTPFVEALSKTITPSVSNRPITPSEKSLPLKTQTPFLGPKQVVPPVNLPPLPTDRPTHFHEEIKILDKDNLPAFLGAPIPKKKAPRRPEEEKIEYGVIAKIIGSGMTTGVVSTMVLAIVIYGLIYYFFLREELVIVPTPTPTPVKTSPITEANELEEIFRTTSITTFSIPADSNLLIPEFQSFLDKEILAQNEVKRIRFLTTQPSEILTFVTLLDKLSIRYPVELDSWVKNNNIVLLYGQIENVNSSSNTDKRVVFIVEVRDVTKVTEIMKNWETTMTDDLKNFFGIDPSRGTSTSFLDNEYRAVKIRYKNFPLPDRTIDYAIVYSLAGRYYLILTNSRESIYFPIDKIKGI